MIFVNFNDWLRSVSENVTVKTISEIFDTNNFFRTFFIEKTAFCTIEKFFCDETVLCETDSVFDRNMLEYENVAFCHENDSNRMKANKKKWNVRTKWKIDTDFFEFFYFFSIIVNISDVFVKIFFLASFNSVAKNFFCNKIRFVFTEKFFTDNFLKKSILKRDEFFIEIWKKNKFEMSFTEKMLFKSVIVLNVNEFWKT